MPPIHRRSDVPFFLVMGGIASCFVLLIGLLLAADLAFTSLADFRNALAKPEIQASIRLTVLSCTVSAILAVIVAIPLAYLLSRFQFPGRVVIDTLVDIPMVLPPVVLGLSLLILFHLPMGGSDWELESWLREDVGFPVTYRWPAIVLAQFTVACAFAVRTMGVTFEQISPRSEDVARTLGCTRMQAFTQVALPQAGRGIIAALTIAWARALGEFGPILVFAGATRMRTEVLSTSVWLEFSVGDLDAAVAVSLLMVLIAIAVLLTLRGLGTLRLGVAASPGVRSQ
ncbi:ABC transporter permease [Allorhodopirellula heiligendammensis]|uniref:Sulfate transport system permease protein CysW n=1 Tax=Allorhodopirellula heiligendammensis TaxID=2714739 RepID=A0A5C6BY37_9BACT|nr:ABC transporter permease [Allorhodopirellula heiligendammensis]TWU16712.1 Sulfate transport system permease protein CysW [Allorhodopirellula heiligendammensis]